ncbi:hypothetical protein ACLOJK_001969 [Asimina triloba]
MASFSSSHALFCSPKCSYSGENDKSGNSNKHPIKINGFSSTTKNATILMTTSTAPPAAAEKLAASSIGIIDQANRQNIPTKKQSVDHFRQGLITDGGVGYTQTVVVRSYEVGADKTATLETILNLLQKTRRLSKMPDEVRAEISPWFIDRYAIEENGQEKIIKLDDNAMYVNSDLKPKRSDLDMNHHVNNVKYVRWMLETIPEIFLETHQLSSIVLEYRRECGSSDIVQSLCQPDENSVGFYLGTQLFDGNGHSCAQSYTHLLQIKGSPKNEEIVLVALTMAKLDTDKKFNYADGERKPTE